MTRFFTAPFRLFGRLLMGFFRAPYDLAKIGWQIGRSLVSDSRQALSGGLRKAANAETSGRRLDIDTILLTQRRARFGFAYLLFTVAMVPAYVFVGGTFFDAIVALMLLVSGVAMNLVSLFAFSVACGRKASFISNIQFYAEDTKKMLSQYKGVNSWGSRKALK